MCFCHRVRWHRAGFRRYWSWKSQRRGGRPPISADLRTLIWRMSLENVLWGAPRIQGERQFCERRSIGLVNIYHHRGGQIGKTIIKRRDADIAKLANTLMIYHLRVQSLSGTANVAWMEQLRPDRVGAWLGQHGRQTCQNVIHGRTPAMKLCPLLALSRHLI
jgi:hypothetical protein